MKLLKCITFLSILVGIFLIVYRNCDREGLGRYWISFKMAVFISLILAGLIPSSVEATDPIMINESPQMERIVKLSGGDQSKFGPGARAKADARRNAKGSGSFMIPGADGFVSSQNYSPYQKPLAARRFLWKVLFSEVKTLHNDLWKIKEFTLDKKDCRKLLEVSLNCKGLT